MSCREVIGRGCVGVARESACEGFHKGCEVVDRDSLSENSDSLAEVRRPRIACTKTATQEWRRVRIVPLEKMPLTLRVAGEESSWMDQGQAGDTVVSQWLVLRQEHSTGAKCAALHLLQSSLGLAPLEWALFTEGGGVEWRRRAL